MRKGAALHSESFGFQVVAASPKNSFTQCNQAQLLYNALYLGFENRCHISPPNLIVATNASPQN
ncbi:hypothetical protein RRF57_002961 [Xylaria bambusicola]|uniref:Uncharacterized protein n=1 Tax=Xylaria bambusicola TaxID=326684 RepID=A0AAN7Z786_9PEZI